jgi:hypothetical protein
MNIVLGELKDSAKCRYLGKILRQYFPSPLKKSVILLLLRGLPLPLGLYSSLLCPLHTPTHSPSEPRCHR